MKITDFGTAKPRLSLHTILFRMTAGLFVLTMLSVFLVCGMFAKYVISDTFADAAVVKSGVSSVVVLEHEANETYDDSGIYELDKDKEVTANSYGKVLPGVDIPKDPFIRLTNLTSTEFELYLSVAESNNFPDKVSYEIDSTLWLNQGNGVYQYIGNIAISDGKIVIPILKGDTLEVSDHYVRNGVFSLNFYAWIVQKEET